MSIVIENILETHLGTILQIQKETNLSKWKVEDYKNEIKEQDSLSLMAKSDIDGVIAFAIVRLLKEKNDEYDSAEILNIAVADSQQNTGIGQKLFDKIKYELAKKSVFVIWLEVRESNEKAIKFYRKNGFVLQFKRKKYYSNPNEDALILKVNYEN